MLRIRYHTRRSALIDAISIPGYQQIAFDKFPVGQGRAAPSGAHGAVGTKIEWEEGLYI